MEGSLFCLSSSIESSTISLSKLIMPAILSQSVSAENNWNWRNVARAWSRRPLPIKKRLVGLVIRRPPREWKIPVSNPACARIFSGSSHIDDSKTGTPVATLPGAWRSRVSAGTSRPGVSILWLGEVESLICNFYLSVAARKIVWADPSLRCTSLLLGR